jgi:RHS repeat-associated protein
LYCNSSTTGVDVGIGLYTTVKNENGSLSPFALHHGTATPGAGFPSTSTFMEWLPIPVSSGSVSNGPRIIPEDLNGDGLTDVIAVTTAGIAAAYGMGNGTISAITTILTPGLSITDPSQVYIHDVNGDGLADILVVPTTGGIQFYANQNGEQFAFIADLPTVLPGLTGANTSLSFGDMNGSGVDDVIVVQKGASGNNAYYVDLFEGLRPGLLSTVTNGLGGTTALTYENTLQLDVAARTEGTPWARHVPQLLHHVTKIVTTNGLPGVYAQTLETDYAYTNPVYDGRDQRFVGFQQVQKHAIGDTENDQSGSVRTTYLTGICLYDNSSGTPCPAAAADRPFLSLTGAPVLVETFDDFGNYLSTVHTTYQVKEIETGTDGTFVRYALPTAVDTYLYDTASPSSTIVAETAINAVFPDSNEPVGQIQGALNLHGPSTHLQKNKTYDLYGNVLTAQDVGIVGTDQTITTTTTWQLAPGDPTFWLWTKHTEITTPFTSVGAFSDPGRSTTYTYSAQGDLKTVQVALSGTRALNRHDTASRQTAPTPTDASSGPLVEVKNQVYDQYGNATQSLGPNGVSCEQITYDPQFAQLPITDVIYTASPSTCSGAGITTSRAYQRGFEAQALQTDPGGPFTATTYDGFGRPLTVTKSSSTNVTQYSPKAAVIMAYADTPNESVYVQTWDGTTYRNKWVYSDGLGNSILTLTEAAGTDPGTWIASGIQKRGARGHVTDVYLPYFLSSITPASLSLAAVQPTSTPQHTIYDGFARPLFSTGYDGNANSQTYYHAVSTDAYDALHLQSGSNPLPTTTQKDGHGRVVLTTVRGRIGSSPTVTTVQTARSYTATGNLTTLSRSSGGSTVTQSMAYDSLGRMVENQEPNTTSGTNDWRYAYNDSGELVGTSDPRGCGVNIAYDAAGREISEDYSECEPNHVNYTPPQLTGAGSEALYVYDAPLGSTATSPDGRRYATISRGELTTFTYDPRGRLYTVTRTLPKPGTPADDWHARFSDSSFSYAINYDDADRVTTQGTGATALAVSGASSVTTSYDERGNIGSVTSSYGSLVTSTQFDFDGQMLEYQYGDHAQTYAKRSYDSLRRLSTSNVARSPAWVQPGNGYTLPSDDSTLEQILEAKTIGYDLIGNPLTITDPSGTTKWPTGAARMTRTATYDDFYHVVTVTDNTGGDTYVQPYGPEFASGTDSPVPATIVTPRVSSQTFNYDWLGNTTQSTDDQQIFYDRSLGTISNDPVYANRITGAVGSTASDNLSVSYDAQGDVTNVNVSRSKPLTSSCISNSFVYQWDELGRMSRATRTDLVKTSPLHVSVTPADITYAYDASGQRVLKTVSNDQQLTTLYTAEIFPTLRLNGATWNSSTSQYEDDVTTESVYLAGAGGVLARVAYSTTDPQVTTTGSLDNLHVLFELTDALGSTSFVIDRGTSELVEAATYQPYGALDSDLRTSRWGNFREQYKFTGKEDDIEVGLTYFGGRYYAPNLGRWMSADPMAVHKLQADLNTYAYVSGRVFRVTDPTGFDGEDSEDSSYSFGANTSSSGFFDNLWNVGDTLGQAADAVSQFASDFADSILPGALSGATAGASSLMGLGPGQSPGDQAGFQFGAVIGTGAQMVATDGASEFVTVGAEVAGDVGAAAGQMFARGAPAAQIADLGDVAANAVTPAATPAAATGATAAEGATYAEGSFSVIDWTGYPEGMPRPDGALRVLSGDEYAAARALANETNAGIRAANGLEGSGLQIHEIQPVKFGGSPTDMANKMLLPTAEHIGPDGVHPQFWQPLLQWVTGGGG